MKVSGYGEKLSQAYDALNGDVNYAEWADFYEACVARFCTAKGKHVCEMACGTGSMALELEKRGWHVTAFDASNTMLTLADKKAQDAGVKNIRFTQQDMRDFRVYTPAQMILCMMDSLNCLAAPGEVASAFESAYHALEDGGIFIFDVNARHKFETVYAENAYVLEDEDVLLAWQNFYNRNTKKCDMYLTFFFENADGRYDRYDEKIRQRMYPARTLERLLADAGFEVLCRTGGFDFSPADENTCDRLFYVCGKKKQG